MTRPISTLVILINMSTIVGSVLVGGIATRVLGNEWLGVFSGGLTFLVIIFSEIIPKTLGERHAETVSLFAARPLSFVTMLLSPLIWIIERITGPLTKGGGNALTTNESEIRILAKIGHEEGVIEKRESTLIQRVFELNDTTALDLMTPRVKMTSLRGPADLVESKPNILASVHSRIIVLGKTSDDVLGVVYKNELLSALIQQTGSTKIADYIHPIKLVTEDTPADDLLTMFQTNRQHLAVVIDQYTAVRGVVSLEDVLEILTGEIVDETDVEVDLQKMAKKDLKKLEQAQPEKSEPSQ